MARLARLGMGALTVGLIATMSTAVVVGGRSTAVAQTTQRVVRGGSAPAPDVVKDQYIVRLAEGRSPGATVSRDTIATDVDARAAALSATYGGQVMYAYRQAIHGFSVRMSAEAADRMARDPAVESVRPVQRVRLDGQQPNPPSWALDRIDQSYLPLDNSYTYPNDAAGVTAFVIDSGIRYTHQDFGGRAVPGFDAFGGDGSDCFGHGTAVADILGGTAYGVAKSVQLVSVRAFDCGGNGTTATVIAGIDWIGLHSPSLLSVANMSFSVPADDDLASAVLSLQFDAQIVASAGNLNAFGCDYYPGGISGTVITVGATDRTDTRWAGSNWGACNDLFAPGVEVPAAASDNDTATALYTGTSFAAPQVAGEVAMLMFEFGPNPNFIADRVAGDTGKSHRILRVGNPNLPIPNGSWHAASPPSVSAASRVTMTTNGDRVDAFVAGLAPGRPILHASQVGGVWTAWENLGGTTTGNPTAIWISSTRLEVWVNGPGRAAWHRWWDGAWHDWESVGGTVAPTADLVAVSPEPGALDLYAISSGDSALWWRNFDGYVWSPWASFGGTTLRHNFSVVVNPMTGGETVFVQGTDSAAWYQVFDGQTIFGWVSLGGTIRWDIKAVADGPTIHVFVPGPDKAVWHRFFFGRFWDPGWERIGGTVGGDGVEATAWEHSLADLYARSTDGRVYGKRWNNGVWSGWFLVTTDQATAIPTATGVLTFQVELSYPVTNGSVVAARWS